MFSPCKNLNELQSFKQHARSCLGYGWLFGGWGAHTHTHVCCSGSSATIHEVHRWNTVYSCCLMMMMQRQTLNRTLRLMCKSFAPPPPPNASQHTYHLMYVREHMNRLYWKKERNWFCVLFFFFLFLPLSLSFLKLYAFAAWTALLFPACL